ncbi:MAG: hypothetical protein ABJ311_05940 [Erythrobacter sp.]
MKISREVDKAHRALYAKHSAKGALQSGAAIIASIQLIEEHANRYLDQAIEMVGQVVKDEEAFDLIVAQMTAAFRSFESHKSTAARHACGGPSRAPKPSVISAADTKFAEVRDLVMQRLQIEQFAFNVQSKPAPSPKKQNPMNSQSKNAGGKPLAKHWDAMWADIATQLWSGDLAPKSQADIKQAMFDWLNNQGIDAGDTAVTQRARALWQRMQSES